MSENSTGVESPTVTVESVTSDEAQTLSQQDKTSAVESATTDVDSSKGQTLDLSKFDTLEKAQAEILKQLNMKTEIISSRNDIKSELSKIKESIKTKEEEAAKTELLEKERFRELYEAELSKNNLIIEKQKQSALNAALEKELKNADVQDINAALKLIDSSGVDVSDDFVVNVDAITKVVGDLKDNHSVLFVAQTPSVVRTSEVEKPGYEAELRELLKNPNVTFKDKSNLKAKYGIE